MTARARATWIGYGALGLWWLTASLTVRLHFLPPMESAGIALCLGGLSGYALGALGGFALRDALRPAPAGLALGLFGIFGSQSLYYVAIAAGPTALVNLIIYLWPALAVIGLGAMGLTRLGPRAWAGLGLALAGVGVVALPGLSFDAIGPLGPLTALGCALIWAVYSVLTRHLAEVPTASLAPACLASGLLALALSCLQEPLVLPSAMEALVLLASGVGPMGLAFYAWDHGMKQGDALALSVAGNAAPLGSTLVLAITGEAVLDAAILVGAVLVATGAALAARPAPAR